ncbi:MAG: hypothetical protein HY658_01215 [Actinobacteria bacterium]|nr:hypothetical protein [Actinomycetota bacterium]
MLIALFTTGLAAAGAAVLWVAITLGSGLVFHLQPALAGLAAGWAYRRTAPGRPPAALAVTAVPAVSAAAVALGVVAIRHGSGPLDPTSWIAAVAAAGALGGVVLALRPRPGRP